MAAQNLDGWAAGEHHRLCNAALHLMHCTAVGVVQRSRSREGGGLGLHQPDLWSGVEGVGTISRMSDNAPDSQELPKPTGRGDEFSRAIKSRCSTVAAPRAEPTGFVGSGGCVVCYLDYDGVLHPDAVARRPKRGIELLAPSHTLFEWCSILEDALQPWPSVRLVLSTSWVREVGFDRARARLTPSLSQRVVGATFHRGVHGPTRELTRLWAATPRGDQIHADLVRRRARRWFAIDDAVNEFGPSQRTWLVECDGRLGLSDEATRARLDEVLRAAHESIGAPEQR